VRDEDGRLQIVEHLGQPGDRGGRIKWRVGGAGSPGCQGGDDQIGGSRQKDGDDLLAVGSQRSQASSQAAGASVEHPICQRGPGVLDDCRPDR